MRYHLSSRSMAGETRRRQTESGVSVRPEASRKVSTHQRFQVTDTQANEFDDVMKWQAKTATADDQRAE